MTGEPFSFEPYPSPGPTAPPAPQTRTGDVIVTIVELVVLLLGGLLVTLLAALVGLFVEAADGGDSSGLMAWILVPTWGLWLVAVAASVALMSAKKLAFWVPMVAFAVWIVLLIVVTHV